MKRYWIGTLLFSLGLCVLPLGFTAEKKKTDSHKGHEHEEKRKDEHGHSHEESEEEEGAHAGGEDGHDDHAEHGAEDKHGHGEKDEHGHGGEHEEEGAGGNIGPDKGLLSYSEKTGFVLSPEASKTFEILNQAVSGSGPWTLPSSALVHATSNTTIFRLRAGAYKAIPVSVLSKTRNSITLRSSHLRSGDSVVTKGASYLRIAEVDATSGEVGHSH